MQLQNNTWIFYCVNMPIDLITVYFKVHFAPHPVSTQEKVADLFVKWAQSQNIAGLRIEVFYV